MKRTTEKWLYFCLNLQGFICYRNGKEIEKSALFWSHKMYKIETILSGNTDIELKPRES